jgi:hypothetical protein
LGYEVRCHAPLWQHRLLVGRTALKRLFRDPSNSIEYDAVTNSYCSRRSDHGVDPSAGELPEIADSHPVVANECPKNISILGQTVLSKRRHHTSGIE